ncbi:hypothetical protein BGZ76_007649 [Entomortierella beljakovae]|nr:hypothetical protein BGZ76_007649 [Entomortierella beljakovae]
MSTWNNHKSDTQSKVSHEYQDDLTSTLKKNEQPTTLYPYDTTEDDEDDMREMNTCDQVIQGPFTIPHQDDQTEDDMSEDDMRELYTRDQVIQLFDEMEERNCNNPPMEELQPEVSSSSQFPKVSVQSPKKRKRPATSQPVETKRTKISMEEKKIIIEYHRDNPKLSHMELSKMFDISKSTLSNILAQGTEIRVYPKTPMEEGSNLPGGSYRMSNIKPSLVDQGLAKWIDEQHSIGIRLTEKAKCAQAADISKTIEVYYDLKQKPCKFSTSWLDGSLKRCHQIRKEILTSVDISESDKLLWEAAYTQLTKNEYNADNIFICAVTSLYCVEQCDRNQGDYFQGNTIASVLLACNMSRTKMMDPIVEYRDPGPIGQLNSPRTEELLMALGGKTGQKALLIDHALWSSIEPSRVEGLDIRTIQPEIFEIKTIDAEVFVIPSILASRLPMTEELIRNFKIQYYSKRISTPQLQGEGPQEYQSKVVSDAWYSLKDIVDTRSQILLSSPLGLLEAKSPKRNSSQIETSPSGSDGSRKLHEHYAAQNGVTGPSNLVFTIIKELIDKLGVES